MSLASIYKGWKIAVMIAESKPAQRVRRWLKERSEAELRRRENEGFANSYIDSDSVVRRVPVDADMVAGGACKCVQCPAPCTCGRNPTRRIDLTGKTKIGADGNVKRV